MPITYQDLGKIDSIAVNGLLGVYNSLAYKVNEIEVHLHSYGRWYETAAAPSGETNVADRIGNGGGSFQMDAGNDDWGAWIQVLGSADTPAEIGNTYYDMHRLHISAAERTAVYFIQIAFGATAAGALTAGTYTELIFEPQSVQGKPAPIELEASRQTATTKVWARCKCPGQNTATLNFYVGLHEYAG